MGIMSKLLRRKAGLFKAGLFLLVGVFVSTSVLANTAVKDPDLVAFYKQVFETPQIKSTIKPKAKPKKQHRNQLVKQKAISNDNGCTTYLSGTETQFALDLKRKKENLRLLLSDNKITKQNKDVKRELSRINDLDTEILLDLVQSTSSGAFINFGENRVRCKKVKASKPIQKIVTSKKEITPVSVIEQKKIETVQTKKPEEAPSSPIEKEKEKEDDDDDDDEEKLHKSALISQIQKPTIKKCTANSNVASPGSGNDMAALFAKAFGKKTTIAAPSQIEADLRINNSTLGELDLFSGSSGVMDSADTEKLLLLLEEVLKEHVFVRIKQALEKSKKTRFCELNEQGIATYYNSTNLSLDIEIAPELRKPQILSLLHKQKATVREENKVKAQKVSGFLNAFTNIGINSRDSETDLKMRLEGSLNIGGAVFETTTNYRNDKFDHGRTTLTYDRPEKLQRFALGNISTGNRNFQENLELDGVRISKEFFLDPNLQISPRANESLHLDSDSEVELYINNQLIRRFYLNAGVYSLQDIGLYDGANNIRVRIKDEFGKVTVKTSQQYYDSHLLKPGLSLFAISVGYLSNQQKYTNDDLEKSPIFSGYYQKGLSKDLTISVDAQLSAESYLLGAETISSLSLGSIRNSIAISGGKERDAGFATSFEYRPNKKHEQISLDTLRQDLLGLDTRSRGLLHNWSITGEYRSKDFSVLNGTDPDLIGGTQEIDGVVFGSRVFNNNHFKGNLQTNFNLNFSEKWQGTLNLGMADYYDSEKSYYANLSTTRRFENGMRLSLGTRYDTEDDFSMNLQLSIPLSRKKGKRKIDLDVLADSRDSAYESKLSIKPTSLVGKNSLAGSLEHFADKDSRQEHLDIQYRNTQFETKFTARNRYNKGSKNTSQQVNLGFNTALACVGSSCATSYPINDSFALVSGPSNQTAPIAISNNNLRFRYSDGNDTGLPDNYNALIPGKGKKAVVRLESYRSQNINIDEGTLPNGYDTEKTEFSVFPKYHQGFLLKAGGEPATTLDGMLFDDENKPLSLKGGQWIPENEGKIVAFFSNKGGRFRVTSIPPGQYKLELFDFPDMKPIQINVPDTKGKVHDIGNLIISTPN